MSFLFREPLELKRKFFQVNGLRIHTYLSAEQRHEPPLILVHGVGMSGRYLTPTACALAGEYEVYIPDLPGFGRSDKPKHILNLQELADSLADWMRTMNFKQVAFLGNSFGCQIIVDLAVRYPEQVARVILQGPTVVPYSRTAFKQFLGFCKNAVRSPPSLAGIFVRDYWDCGLKRFFYTFQSSLKDPIEVKLPKIRCPAMVVRGTRDPFVSQRWAEEAAQALPHGCLRLLPGAGHPAVYRAPLELARIVQPFLEEEASAEFSIA